MCDLLVTDQRPAGSKGVGLDVRRNVDEPLQRHPKHEGVGHGPGDGLHRQPPSPQGEYTLTFLQFKYEVGPCLTP